LGVFLKNIPMGMIVLLTYIVVATVLISIILIVENPFSRGVDGEKSNDRGTLFIKLDFPDGAFFRRLSPDESKMTIELTLSIKNIGNKPVYITRIEVPDLNWTVIQTDVILLPGEVWKKTFVVIEDMPYTYIWEHGTVHTVLVYFKVEGYSEELMKSVIVTVM